VEASIVLCYFHHAGFKYLSMEERDPGASVSMTAGLAAEDLEYDKF
jgi:hypothetical protein